MSLVAYGSSDESSDEEVTSKEESVKQIPKSAEVKQSPQIVEVQQTVNLLPDQPRSHISLPAPKTVEQPKVNDQNNSLLSSRELSDNGKINFNLLPKPKYAENVEGMIEDDDDYIPPQKSTKVQCEKPVKKEKAPIKISVPSLSDFKDLDEEKELSRTRIKPSQKGTGLFAVLPPPRSETLLKPKSLVPRVLAKTPADPKIPSKSQQRNTIESKKIRSKSINVKKSPKSTIAANYDSNSEDEDNSDNAPKMDFFSLLTTADFPIPAIPIADIVNETLKYSNSQFIKPDIIYPMETSKNEEQPPEVQIPDKTLVSNVMNLPKEEIIQKNKAEVGPKLPVPEQDYNVDSTGNVVFDDKAIEYLCGKRGVKRKNKELEGVDIIEISGEDIKPDERDWLVKALTEEPVARPSASQGAGPSGQSKKKHQITYLAHQAKAMEVELKNQWAQNKMTRQQTQSKYGF